MGEVCNTCGLPDELCVCEDMDKSSHAVSTTIEERSYDKKVTIIEGFNPNGDIDLEELASELKSSLGCGGTTKDNSIELQGDHRGKIEPLLEDHGIELTD